MNEKDKARLQLQILGEEYNSSIYRYVWNKEQTSATRIMVAEF